LEQSSSSSSESYFTSGGVVCEKPVGKDEAVIHNHYLQYHVGARNHGGFCAEQPAEARESVTHTKPGVEDVAQDILEYLEGIPRTLGKEQQAEVLDAAVKRLEDEAAAVVA